MHPPLFFQEVFMTEADVLEELFRRRRELTAQIEGASRFKLVEIFQRIWAIEEMIPLVQHNPFHDCEWLIESFSKEMHELSAGVSEGKYKNNSFSLAADEADNFLVQLEHPTE